MNSWCEKIYSVWDLGESSIVLDGFLQRHDDRANFRGSRICVPTGVQLQPGIRAAAVVGGRAFAKRAGVALRSGSRGPCVVVRLFAGVISPPMPPGIWSRMECFDNDRATPAGFGNLGAVNIGDGSTPSRESSDSAETRPTRQRPRGPDDGRFLRRGDGERRRFDEHQLSFSGWPCRRRRGG